MLEPIGTASSNQACTASSELRSGFDASATVIATKTTTNAAAAISPTLFICNAGPNAPLTRTYCGERFCVKWRTAIHKNERSSMCRSAAVCYAGCVTIVSQEEYPPHPQ